MEPLLMERLSEREEILLGHASRDPFGGYLNKRSSEVDFQDVFGGPPRRGRADSLNLFPGRGRRCGVGEEVGGSRRACSGLGEKPVFGEVGSPGRRKPVADDFFNDIFQSSDCWSPKGRRAKLDSFGSLPCSRIVSPTIQTLTPRSDAFLRGSSLPTQLSLSRKLGEMLDNQTASYPSQRTLHKNDEGVPSVASQAVSLQEDHRMEAFPTYRQSPLSRHFAYSFEKTSKVPGSASFSRETQARKNQTNSEGQSRSSRFHFSLYKWAGKGVTLMMPSNLKERSNNGNSGRVLPEIVLQEVDMHVDDEIMATISKTSKINGEDQDGKLANDLIVERTADPVIKEDLFPSEPEQNVIGSGMVEESDRKVEALQTTLGDSYLSNAPNDTCQEIPSTRHEAKASIVNTLHDLFEKNGGKQGNTNIISPAEEIRGQRDAYEHASLNLPSDTENNVNHNEASPSMDGTQDIPISVEDELPGKRGKVRVKEFIKIFSRDAAPTRPKETRSKETSGIKSQKPVKKDVRKRKVEKEESEHASNTDETKVSSGKDEVSTDNPITISQILQQAEDPYLKFGSDIDVVSDSSLRKDGISVPESTKKVFYDSADIAEETHDLEECLVEQLPQNQNEHPQTDVQQDQFKIADTKIREWSKGKEGNIRSLLSTLQYVLWRESGWKPVPLVDIIEGNAVKRAYQKALLCLHPDKLQQKCAAAHQKYIAEKVFDILQRGISSIRSMFFNDEMNLANELPASVHLKLLYHNTSNLKCSTKNWA
ncbi:putative Chaperone J-domain superfamily [Dioscorea sansibarensis]